MMKGAGDGFDQTHHIDNGRSRNSDGRSAARVCAAD
jgi:hypothetical protein